MRLVNLTPHEISIEGCPVIPRTNIVCRLLPVTNEIQPILDDNGNPFPVVENVLSEKYLVGLPEPEEGTMYIVSSIVQDFARGLLGRTDVISPDTSPESVVRDANGKVIGSRRFQILIKEVNNA